MKPYADHPVRAGRQVLGDLLALLWTVLWVRLGFVVHEQVARLAGPGRSVEDAGDALQRNLSSAGDAAGRVPLVGEDLRSPFESAAGAGRTLADAGRAQQDAVGTLATTLGLLVALVPLLLVLRYAWRRWRWAHEAAAARALLGAGADASLFALRALAHRSLPALRSVQRRTGADPVQGWRDADPATVQALAALELDTLGLRRR